MNHCLEIAVENEMLMAIHHSFKQLIEETLDLGHLHLHDTKGVAVGREIGAEDGHER